MLAAVEQVLAKTGLKATDIDILVTTGSTFHPVLSLGCMLVNAFKMRRDVKSYHLGCMACAAGALGINLLRDLLKANRSSIALFVAHENVTAGCYLGSDTSKFLANALFGMGAAALVLTNKRSLAGKAKYKLLHSARAHVGQDDKVYRSMGIFEGDPAGDCIKYTADVPMAAAAGIRAAMAMVAPKVLSCGQLAAAAKAAVLRRLKGPTAAPRYIPSFADSTIDHFLLHPGSHGLLKGFMKGLGLTVQHTLPSAAALRDYGNTSPSSTYYVLAYLESLVGVSKGQKLMQVSVGTGVKAGVNVWQALRDIKEQHPAWQHLQGVPVTEADLPLPLRVVQGEDSHADTARALKAMSVVGPAASKDVDVAASG
uniref:FAE domain-containing protein n=1 Tax=Tetradesmus obliquus TaxID=3088 RepID=A0A383V531_TETOB|eukprot:jgi/Sobl393_1/252/SZX60040.1